MSTYSGSSSDTETEPEGTGSSPQRTLINRSKKSDSGPVENLSHQMIHEVPFSHFQSPIKIEAAHFIKIIRLIFCCNKFLRPQLTRMRRPWSEAVWRNPCWSWTTTSTIHTHIWKRTAGGFPSTSCCTRSHPWMAKQETDSVWVFKQLVVHG